MTSAIARAFTAVLATGALASGAMAQTESGEPAAPALEVMAQLPGGPGNITVTEDGLVVVSVHPSFPAEGAVAMAVTPEGEFSWFPLGEGTGDMSRVLSVRADGEGQVWLLAGTPGPRPKTFYIVDAETGALARKIEVDAPGSFFNDMALALDRGVVVISDPGAGNGLAILDVEAGTSRRVLVGHESVSPEDVDAPIDGVPLAQGRGPDGELTPMRSGVNPITIDSAHEWVYFGAMTATSLWRVRLDDLLDESLTEDELAARVERHGDKAPSAGITMDEAGNVYVADVGARGIGVTTPDGAYRVLVQDDELLDWPDGLAVGPDGYVYVAANGLYRGWASHSHYGRAEAPFALVRFKALAETKVGR